MAVRDDDSVWLATEVPIRMVNFQDPAIVASYSSITDMLWHTMTGLFVWEFIITLDYEWSIFRGRRPYRWTVWMYSITRVATLLAMVVITFHIFLSNLAFATASLLIVLRIIAIWNRQMVIVAISIGVWVINVAFLIQGVVRNIHLQPRSFWLPAQGTCATLNLQSCKPTVISVAVTDFILLLIMLLGLLRLRLDGGTLLGLGRILWKQVGPRQFSLGIAVSGIVWLLVATVAEVPPAYSSLPLFSSAHRGQYRYSALDSLQRSDRSVSKTMQSTTAQDSQNQTGIMVHTIYVQYPMPQTSDRNLVTSTEREHHRPNELIADEDLEKRAEDRITVT
ncbi:hypothetical protein BJV74DRAFT_798427 [Russula compacta]|nr:hypothetical protein BJV74DRAFT_798427 [Russula compacta]